MHYTKLDLWVKSVNLTLAVYGLTSRFPQDELYGLSSQMRKAAISIPSNVAEGQGRASFRDNRRFVSQARGSLFELQTQAVIAEQLGYLTPAEWRAFDDKALEVGQLLHGMLRSLKRRMFDSPRPTTNDQRITNNE